MLGLRGGVSGTTHSSSSRRARTAALLALFAFALAFQGSRPIWDPDEGRYVHVALNMVRSGDWFTPHLHREVPHFTKPPLIYWAVGGSIALLGRNEWAARLPNALAFAATALLVAALARRLAPGREALAAVIYATSLLPFVAANIVSTDTLLAAAETLAVAGFVAWRFDERPHPGALVLMWGGLGLAFLTKGPPGLLPLLALLAFVGWQDGWRKLGRLLSPLGLILFALLAFGWYAAQLRARPDLLPYLLGEEVVDRVVSAEFNRNSDLHGFLKTYPPVIALGLAPWLFVWVVRRLRSRDRAAGAAVDPGARLLALWVVLPLAIFFLADSRLPLYLLPLAAPGSLLLARTFPADWWQRPGIRRAVAAWVLVLLAIKGVSALHATDRDGRRAAELLQPLLLSPPIEIVFINRKPLYSLGFYIDTAIERVALDSVPISDREPSYRPVAQTLTAELEEHEPATLFLVPPKLEPAFLRDLAALGAESRRLGEIPNWLVYGQPRTRPPHPGGETSPRPAP